VKKFPLSYGTFLSGRLWRDLPIDYLRREVSGAGRVFPRGRCWRRGWKQDRADPHARERALNIAREHPPAGVFPAEAIAKIQEVLESIGDTSCPECPLD
jgi:hypothetical protein